MHKRNYKTIPKELIKLNRWICFKLIYRGEYEGQSEIVRKSDKIPIDPNTGKAAKVNDKTTWSDFETATDAIEAFKLDGIGFILGDGIVGVDLDNVISKEGKITNEAQDIIISLNSYTEISPSKKGVHILLKGKIPEGRRRNGNIEIYNEGRFFTVTGDIFENKNKIEERNNEINKIYNKYIKKDPPRNAAQGINRKCTHENYNKVILSDMELLSIARKAENGDKFKRLFEGDIAGYTSQSEADMALCCMLAFYCANDENKIDNLFRHSGLIRAKWDEKRGNLTYGQITINEAIKRTNNFYSPQKKYNINFTSGEKLKKNIKKLHLGDADFKFLNEKTLELYLKEKKISIKYDVINRSVKIEGFKNKYGTEDIQNILSIKLNDNLKPFLKYCNKETIQDLLKLIGYKNRYNPVLEMLKSNKWDGKDRMKKFYSILNIKENDILSRKLIYCWLHQALSMAKNDIENAYGADGILVFQGKQGIGKTTLVEKLAVNQELCKLGQYLDTRDKDTYRRCSSSWIVELGEIETTFKSDLERLKSFITAPIDQYRLPYGRTDQILARRSVIIGTCNTDNFLVDPTGSRRFWTIPIEKIDLEGVNKFDFLQLWLQIEEETKNNIQGFRLDIETRQLLDERNTQFERKIKGQSEIEDILARDNLKWQDTTITAFREAHIELSRFTVQQIGQVLKKIGIESREIKIIKENKRITKRILKLPL